MKTPKSENNEYAAFSSALEKVLKVSHSELKSRLEVGKKQKEKGNAEPKFGVCPAAFGICYSV